MRGFDVSYYTRENGTKPAKIFIDGLQVKMRAKVFRLIVMLEKNGSDLREPESKHLGDGIFELRARFGSDITRVLYFFVIGRRIILSHGFVKKTEKTPPGEIDKAKQYRSDYLSKKPANKKSREKRGDHVREKRYRKQDRVEREGTRGLLFKGRCYVVEPQNSPTRPK